MFDDSIREQNRDGKTGELAVLFDRHDRFLAVGLYDPASPIRVRILHAGSRAEIDHEWFRARLAESLARRTSILDARTNAARLINGESDHFPALVLDRYAETLVLKLYSSIWFPWHETILALIQETLQPERLVLRLSRNITQAARGANLTDGQIISGPPLHGTVPFLESGLHFEADVLKGQKTGFFLDQRENRRLVETLSSGKHVLNAFSFSGGFSLYAARGGARSITDVDISAHALESSRRNFARNQSLIGTPPHELLQADVFEWLRHPGPKRYDLVILDPPSLAKREADKPAALHAYAALALSGAALVKPHGTLLCCSCSGHVHAAEFFDTVTTSLRRSGRNFEILKKTAEPPDHHAAFREAEYLKGIYLAF